MGRPEWIFLKNKERWFEIKDRYVNSFRSHKAASKYCGMPFHTFRRVGKTSRWLPKESFDIILRRVGMDYEDVREDVDVYTGEGKEFLYHQRATKTKKEKYGEDFFRNLSFKKWEEVTQKKRRAHSKKMALKAMRGDKIEEIISNISGKCNIDREFLEYCFSSYRNHGLEDYIDIFCDEDEKKILEILGEGEIQYNLLVERSGMGARKVNEIVHALYDRGIVKVKVPFSRSPLAREENIKCSINLEGIKSRLKEYCEAKAEELTRLEEETEHGYFVCERDKILIPFEEVLDNQYKCPKCLSDVTWMKDEELSVILDVATFVVKKVGSMAVA